MTLYNSLAPSYGVLCVLLRGDVRMDYRQGLLFWYNYTNLQQWTVCQVASFPRQSSNPSSPKFAVLANHLHKGLHLQTQEAFGPYHVMPLFFFPTFYFSLLLLFVMLVPSTISKSAQI